MEIYNQNEVKNTEIDYLKEDLKINNRCYTE